MLRSSLLAGAALLLAVAPARAQQASPTAPAPSGLGAIAAPASPPPAPAGTPSAADGTPLPAASDKGAPAAGDQVQFTADALDYDDKSNVVTATGDVRMTRDGNRLRAAQVVWNRTTGQVVATGDVAVINPQGDIVYGDRIQLTDQIKSGVVDNMLVVLDRGGRFAATQGTRADDGTLDLHNAAYTPCPVVDAHGCPKQPSWRITALRVTYRPARKRIYFVTGRFHLLGIASVPIPRLSLPVGGGSDSGLLTPSFRVNGVNGVEFITPYYLSFGPNRGLTLTPHLFTAVLPMAEVHYNALGERGAFQVTGYATASRKSDDIAGFDSADTEQAFRGYLDGSGRYQLSPEWSISGSIRRTTDRTFLRRYFISYDDRLRSNVKLERVDADSYFVLQGWAVQTLRLGDDQGQQPVALPELDYRRRLDGLLGGRLQLEANTLALSRSDGEDTQRAFASARWDLRKITTYGQELVLTAFARGDLYNTHDTAATDIATYRGLEGFHQRAIGALAADLSWPLIGALGAGTQRFTPRVQLVLQPKIANLSLPNEDSRAVDLDSANLFELNRFSGYDRWEDSTRVTYGGEWAADLPGVRVDAVVGQSYRLSDRPTILPVGTGLSDRFSDITGRTEIRFRDFVSLVHSYRLDHTDFIFRRNEVEATIGSRATYFLLGYTRLDRNIVPQTEDLRDHQEVRLAGRIQFKRYWSAFGSTVIDLTTTQEDPLSLSDGFQPIRHRVGVQYEDDCLRLGLTWRRDYADTGDARGGNSFLLTLALVNIGR